MFYLVFLAGHAGLSITWSCNLDLDSQCLPICIGLIQVKLCMSEWNFKLISHSLGEYCQED